MEEKILGVVNKALDESMKEFLEDPDSIFSDKKEQLTHQYSNIKQLKKWKQNQVCIVKGCKNKSIENSHTIQKSGSIKQISESGHVLTPKFTGKSGGVELVSKGVNEASTFPGYCSIHEGLFNEFEAIKEFENGEHVGLQIYRTVCREIVIKENHLKELEIAVERYKEFRNKKFNESVAKKLSKILIQNPTLKIKDLKVASNDYRMKASATHKKEIIRSLNEFHYKFQDAILKDLQKRKFSKVSCVALTIDREIPVALAGHGNFKVNMKNRVRNIEVIFNVLPLGNKTYVFISTLRKFETELKFYMSYFSTPLQLISMIETWMIHGSDHWFIKPSVWQAIDGKFQTEILGEILDTSHNIGHEFKLSIFNSLKSEVFNLMEQNKEKLDEVQYQLLQKEKAKATNSKIDHKANIQ